ncbi:hypothetical protein [Halalkalibacterium halodurans]|jgi:hypothetical protein|uniref:hypothetical protein n=1 Tax=Halalkalibacterium halodurans TaxID=86665 RepID=UPI000A4B79D0|nr:hypothetical protein [Halalkalibacterium halodurans]TPE69675.1 hypothetical protein AMD02_006940 [Halalkalibacterium halodurans]
MGYICVPCYLLLGDHERILFSLRPRTIIYNIHVIIDHHNWKTAQVDGRYAVPKENGSLGGSRMQGIAAPILYPA